MLKVKISVFNSNVSGIISGLLNRNEAMKTLIISIQEHLHEIILAEYLPLLATVVFINFIMRRN